MLKLKRYLKPYLAFLLCGILFLFGQAMLELELPNYMSNIVNIGIQQGGITQIAPEAIAAKGMQLAQTFMTDADRAAADAAYEEVTDPLPWRDDFPGIEPGDFVLREDADKAAADMAFARSSYAFLHLIEQASEASGMTMGNSETQTMDLESADALLAMLSQLPEGALDEAVAAAESADETVLEQTAYVFTKSYYVQLGADTDAIQTNYILFTGLEMLGFTVLLTVCSVSAGFCLARLGAGVARDLRRDVFTRVTSFTNNEMDKFSTASLITRTTNDVTQVQMFLSMGLRMMCFAPIMGVGSLVMSLRRNLSMAWILLMALIVMLGFIFLLFVIALPRFKKMQSLIDKLNLVSRENLSGMMVIRAFATQDFEEKRFDKANRDLTGNTLFVNRAMVTMAPVMTLLMNGVMLLIVWVGAKYIEASTMQVGDMMAFMQYAMHVIMSFLFISMMFIMVPRATVSAERINEVLETKSTVLDPEQPVDLPKPAKGVVEFRNVSFRYEGASENVLENVSFTARPGETTAFIGSTGSGKTTLVNLVPRFYDVTEGAVLLDGVDVRELRQKDLRAAIGYVPQKGMLFSGTIASNLRYGDENADEATMNEACDVAQATEFIEHLVNGLDAGISQGGTNVSGGQRQRLSIARALVKKAPVYIFDDTFSALDFKTDAKLRKALKGYTEHSTVLVVAQRVSSIMHAEQIVVLDEGRVAGIGTHAELLKTCETYREIAQSQLSKEELA